MSREPQQLSDKTPVKFTSVTAAWSVAVSLLVTGWVVAISYSNILHRLDRMEGTHVKTSQLQQWIDSYRERNPTVNVPPLPASDHPSKRETHGEFLAVISETHNEPNKKRE